MTAVVFKSDYKEGGRRYAAGQFTYLPDAEAAALAQQGVVEIRRPPGPTETKGVAT
jgi:hypothetical protein